MGGSEKVVESMARLYPDAPIFTLFHDPVALGSQVLGDRKVITSCLQRLPGALRLRRHLLPVMPFAVEQFDLRSYDVILSSSHAVAHGVLTRADQLHISYTHTPMRYAWDLYQEYLETANVGWGPISLLQRAILHRMRLWDLAAAKRVDVRVANSQYIAGRIEHVYQQQSQVIYPPVDVDAFDPAPGRDDYYVVVSRLVPYKRVDAIVDAFNELGLPLKVAGGGPMFGKLRARAKANVQLLGEVDQPALVDLLGRCRAFVHAADEDFGISPVEAQAAGAPVIALGKGGTLETVRRGATGVFFDEPTPKAIAQAVREFESCDTILPASEIAQAAARFGRDRFERELRELVETRWQQFTERHQDAAQP